MTERERALSVRRVVGIDWIRQVVPAPSTRVQTRQKRLMQNGRENFTIHDWPINVLYE